MGWAQQSQENLELKHLRNDHLDPISKASLNS